MLCPQGHPLPATGITARFCPTCGSELINPCPAGHDNAAGARFCRDCGRSMVRPTGAPSAVTATLAAETTAVVRSAGSSHSTTAVVRATPATTAVVRTPEPTTAVVPTATPDASPSPRSVGVRGATRTSPPAPPREQGVQRSPRRNRGLLIAIAALAAAVVAVVIAVLATSAGDPVPGASPPAGSSVTSPPSTTAPPASSTTTTLSAQALSQGQALTVLLAQNSANRNQVQAATTAIASCGDLATAQTTLRAAQAARQSLLSQLAELDLSALPQSPQLTSTLTGAWQSSSDSDGSYARWASDEQVGQCVPNDTGNPDYQAALADDGQASTAKQQFTSLWNPIATSLGLQQWQPNQL